jgi:hypothetical protein
MGRFFSVFTLLITLFPLPVTAYRDHLTGVEIEWNPKKVLLPAHTEARNAFSPLKPADLKKAISFVRKAMHQYPLNFFKNRLSQVFLTGQTLPDFDSCVFENQSAWLQLHALPGSEIEERFHLTFARMLFQQNYSLFPLEEWKAAFFNRSHLPEEEQIPQEEMQLESSVIEKDFSRTSSYFFMPWKQKEIPEKEKPMIKEKLKLVRLFYSRLSDDFNPAYFQKMER